MKLVIAEKPSVAAEIAHVAGADKKECGYYSGNGYLISWCIGHLIELAQPEAYNSEFKKWNLESLPIIPEEFKTEISSGTETQYKVLKELMLRSEVTELIEATDAGREGELIFRLVYQKAGCKKPFKRLWISSMEEKSIRNGLAQMKDGQEYNHLYEAALCRQHADWLIGINLTRLYSKMYNKTLNVGRVQTPTLNLIVKRQAEISNFNPQTYFTLTAALLKTEGEFKAYKKVEKGEDAARIAKCCSGKTASVVRVEKLEKKESPDALYDLTTLQRQANRLLGYSAQQTLNYMQTLYDNRLATYPRTDSRYITSDMEASTRALISTLLTNGIYDKAITEKYNSANISIKHVIDNNKVTDHHAIIPTTGVTIEKLKQLPEGERNILLLIAYRLLSAVYTKHSYLTTKAVLDIEGEEFIANGKVIIESGYKMVEEQLKNILKATEEKEGSGDQYDSAMLPPLEEGDTCSVFEVKAEEKKTLPPKAYTEDTLLADMENAGKTIEDKNLREAIKNCGLGTSATRASIIESIIHTGYVQRSGKNLLSTDMACTFINIVTDKLKEPQMTAEWEQQLAAIQMGEMDSDIFMEGITEFLSSLVNETKTGYKPEESKTVFKGHSSGIGTCPKCGKQVIEYGKAYSCESGKGGCGFVIWKKMFGKDISQTQALKLLKKGKSDVIKGFISQKTGKPFEAYLVLKEDKSVGIAFPQTQKPKKG